MIDELISKLGNSKYHCENGPVIRWNDGSYGWYLHGRRVKSYGEFQKLTGCDDEYVVLLKLKWGEIPKHLGLHDSGELIC